MSLIEGDFEILNEDSTVSLCCKYEEPKNFLASLSPELQQQIHTIGNLRTINPGVSYMMHNMLVNEKIQHIIFCDKDSIFNGTIALMQALDKGIQEDGIIAGNRQLLENFNPMLKNFPIEAVQFFQKQLREGKMKIYVPTSDIEKYQRFNTLDNPEFFQGTNNDVSQTMTNLANLQSRDPLTGIDFSALAPRHVTLAPSDNFYKTADICTIYPPYNKQPLRIHFHRENILYEGMFTENNNQFLYNLRHILSRLQLGERENSFCLALGIECERAFLAAKNNLQYSQGDILSLDAVWDGQSQSPPYNIETIQALPGSLILDPQGFFIFSIHPKKEVVIAQYTETKSGAKTNFTVPSRESFVEHIWQFSPFGNYDQRTNHIAYCGTELEKVFIAHENKLGFLQDKKLILQKKNRTNLYGPSYFNADNLSTVWKTILYHLEFSGLHTENQKKGPVVEGWATTWHIPMKSLTIPQEYTLYSKEEAKVYAESFFQKKEEDAAYTYGDRECHHWQEFNQIEYIIKKLRSQPDIPVITQRWNTQLDLTGHSRPCLSGDVWFMKNQKLHTYQFARAHDIIGALPINAWGIVMGWATRIGKELNVELGDIICNSNANNYRKNTDQENMNAILNTLESEPQMQTWKSPSITVHNHTINNKEDLQQEWNDKDIVGLSFPNGEQTDFLFNSKLGQAILHQQIDYGKKLYSYQQFKDSPSINQMEFAVKKLSERPYDNIMVFCFRDPVNDKKYNKDMLLFAHTKVSLGKLIMTGVVINLPLTNIQQGIANYYTLLRTIQKDLAQRLNVPPGLLFIQLAPVIR